MLNDTGLKAFEFCELRIVCSIPRHLRVHDHVFEALVEEIPWGELRIKREKDKGTLVALSALESWAKEKNPFVVSFSYFIKGVSPSV